MKAYTQIIIPAAVLLLLSFKLGAQTTKPNDDNSLHVTQFQTAQGTLEVRWGQPEQAPSGPAPEFSQLDTNNDNFISDSEATLYPMLANDFVYADHNRDGKLSKTEYAKWRQAP